MISTLFAHAGEAHSSDLIARLHAVPWFAQIGLLIVLCAVFLSLCWLLTHKLDTSLLVTAAFLLVAGFISAQFSVLVAVISITTGLVITLGITLIGLGTE